MKNVVLLDNEAKALSWSFCLRTTDRTPRLWDLRSGKCLRKFEGHSAVVYGVMVLEGETQALSYGDETLRLWDLRSGDCLRTFEGHSKSVTGAVLLDNETKALSWSFDETLKLWDLSSGVCLRTFEGHSDIIDGVALLENHTRALSWSWDKTLRLWDLRSGRRIGTLAQAGHLARSAELIMVTPSWANKILTARLRNVASHGETLPDAGKPISTHAHIWSPFGRVAQPAL